MDSRHHFGTQDLAMVGLYSMLILFGFGNCDPVASSSNKESCNVGVGFVESSNTNIIGCFPCSHEYLTGSYFDNHNRIPDLDFHDFLAQEIGSSDLCKGLVNNIDVLGLSYLKRDLSGEGSHRHLVSTMGFDMRSEVLSWLDGHICEAVIIERLPVGVFADPFELQHLVHRRVFLGAAVFGDTNLELPSALSNRSIVEIHMEIGYNVSSKCSETVVPLPLHARYPPLDPSGYARVTIGRPDLFLRCRPKDLQHETCSWTLSSLGVGSVNSVTWRIPCGDEGLAGVVSITTFVSALVCSLLIVLYAINFSGNNDIKRT